MLTEKMQMTTFFHMPYHIWSIRCTIGIWSESRLSYPLDRAYTHCARQSCAKSIASHGVEKKKRAVDLLNVQNLARGIGGAIGLVLAGVVCI